MQQKEQNNVDTKRRTVRIGGTLREIVTIRDEAGAILEKVMRPLRVEFYFRDFLQAIIGALLLATPIAFTQEVWELGDMLSNERIVLIVLMSLLFLSLFVYHNFYKDHFKKYAGQFFMRVVVIYVMSFLVVAVLLAIIDKAPWFVDNILAVKRTVLVALPASMSAAVADMIK
jgi:uncharacterized membrane protein